MLAPSAWGGAFRRCKARLILKELHVLVTAPVYRLGSVHEKVTKNRHLKLLFETQTEGGMYTKSIAMERTMYLIKQLTLLT